MKDDAKDHLKERKQSRPVKIKIEPIDQNKLQILIIRCRTEKENKL